MLSSSFLFNNGIFFNENVEVKLQEYQYTLFPNVILYSFIIKTAKMESKKCIKFITLIVKLTLAGMYTTVAVYSRILFILFQVLN